MKLRKPPTDALRPINPDNARILCLTAAAGTELADAYSSNTVECHLGKKVFTDHSPSSTTWYYSVKLSPIAENSSLLPPIGV